MRNVALQELVCGARVCRLVRRDGIWELRPDLILYEYAAVEEEAPKTIVAEVVDATQEQKVEDLPIEETFSEKMTEPPKADEPPDKTIEVKVIDDEALQQKSPVKWFVIGAVIVLAIIIIFLIFRP